MNRGECSNKDINICQILSVALNTWCPVEEASLLLRRSPRSVRRRSRRLVRAHQRFVRTMNQTREAHGAVPAGQLPGMPSNWNLVAVLLRKSPKREEDSDEVRSLTVT